jgi:hypothetical protein
MAFTEIGVCAVGPIGKLQVPIDSTYGSDQAGIMQAYGRIMSERVSYEAPRPSLRILTLTGRNFCYCVLGQGQDYCQLCRVKDNRLATRIEGGFNQCSE